MKRFAKMRFQMKLLVIFGAIICSFSVIYATYYGITKNMLQKNMIAYSEMYAESINNSIVNMVEGIDQLSRTLLLKNQIIEDMGQHMELDSQEYMAYYQAAQEAIEEILNVRIDVEGIVIADVEGRVIAGGPNSPYSAHDNIRNELWYQDFMKSESVFRFLPLHKSNASEVFSIVRKLRTYEDMQVNGIVRIDMKKRHLDEICKKNRLRQNKVALFDREKSLFYVSGESLTEEQIKEIQKKLSQESKSFSIFKGEDVLNISTNYSPYLDVYVAYIVPQKVLMSELRDLNWIAVTFLILGGGLGVILAITSAKVMAKSVRTVMDGMKEIEEGNLDIRIEVDSNDEIHTIAAGLNHMIQRIKILIEEKTQSEIRKKEAEMMMLQRQIHPHFLYNTLDGIRMKALLNQDYESANMIEKLSALLRRTTDTKTEFVRLQEELDYVNYYIDLQNMRFRYKFQVEICIPEDIQRIIVPCFCLQPLVENAVRHGLEGRRSNRKIRIWSNCEGEDVYLMVEDNGQGIAPDRLQELRETLNNPVLQESEHIGLNNINIRLKLYYGKQYGLSIQSEEKKGTMLILRIPLYSERGKDV